MNRFCAAGRAAAYTLLLSLLAAAGYGQSANGAGQGTVAQTITFRNPGTQTVGKALTLSATASSGLAVSFASETTGVCTVSGKTAAFLKTGTCTVEATQAGNSTYAAAKPVSQSFAVDGKAQTITFNNPGTQTVGRALTLSATASSGLAVSFTSETTSVCAVSGKTATLRKAGTCTMEASQAGNSTYAAAKAVSQSFAAIPVAPGGLTATVEKNSVQLSWAGLMGADRFNVYRGTSSHGESATPIATGIAGTLYADTHVADNTTYYYEVAAASGGETSARSNEASAAPAASAGYKLPWDRVWAWNPGLMSKGGVPSGSWPVCKATSTPLRPLGSNKDDVAQINAAIQDCPVGSVVMLGAGTFLIDPEDSGNNFVFLNKGVVLRGAGAGKTILNNPLNIPTTTKNNVNGNAADPYPLILVGPGEWVNPDGDARCQGLTAYQPQYMQLLSANGAKGSMSVTVADGSIFSAGQYVLLDQNSGASWQPDLGGYATSIWASPDYAGSWFVHNPPVEYSDDPVATGQTPSKANNFARSGSGSDAACWFSRQDRPQNEMKQIASVNGNTVTFTSPLTMTYLMGQYAELTTYTGGNEPVTYAGVEDMTLVGGGDGAVQFTNTAYSWAKNIEVKNWYGDGVDIMNSFRDELRDSYIHDASWAEPGGAGYAISLSGGASEILIENNISMITNKVMVARSSGAGSVVGYNYMEDGYIAITEGWIEIGMNASHMVGSHGVLFEGNQSFNIDSDDTHGNSTHLTFFRNYATTIRRTFKSDYTGDTIDDATDTVAGAVTTVGPKRAIGAMGYSYWMNYVGNVMGEPGVATAANGYVDDVTSAGGGNNEIWLLGWNDGGTYAYDGHVAATAIRDGNWDTLLGKQTWLTDSAAAGAALPNSLYLTSKPAFFQSYTWPWVDPTTGTTYTLPAKARFDAGTPNLAPDARAGEAAATQP